jgi:GAF domain-containing protein
LLSIPLHKGGMLIGMINAARFEVHPFSEKQIALLQNFAAQAVIAIENARLITETREALEQQTATAEVLQVINSSPGDLAPVFDALLEKAMRLCDASMGVFARFDGNRFKPAVSRGVPPRYAEYLATTSDQPSPEGTNQRVLAGENVVQVIDVMERVGYRSGHPWVRALVELGEARSLMTVALRKDGVLLGTITLYRREVRAFTDKQIALLQNFAAQAVIAMENARLLTETREALEQQTATAEVLSVINSSPGDLAPVFDAILEKAHSLCGAEHGALVAYDGEHFRAIALRAMPEPFAGFMREPFRPYPGGVQEGLLRGERLVHIPDVRVRELTSPIPIQQAALDAGIRTLLMVPLYKDEALLGYITAHRREVRPFTDKQIALLQNFAAQAVIAMENARLITETHEALERQTATAEVLQVINSSPGDLTPVFDAILEKAHTLCSAALGALSIFDGEHFRAVATRGLPEEMVGVVRRPYRGNAYHQQLVRRERYVHIPDMRALDSVELGSVGTAVIAADIRTSLLVPLHKDDRLLGFISANRREVQPFTENEIGVLENFAAQAVIAMENARLLTETREALVLNHISGLTRSAPGLITFGFGYLHPIVD